MQAFGLPAVKRGNSGGRRLTRSEHNYAAEEDVRHDLARHGLEGYGSVATAFSLEPFPL